MIYERFGKRVLDLALGGAALFILCPAMAVTALAIWADDRGPVLFRQKRVGQFNKLFTVLKFRSMPVLSIDLPSTKGGSLTVTRVGRVIRRTNFDEVPQLVNVLYGDMSLVGPRPALPCQTMLCELREKNGANRCRPGLTGLAQVNSYDGMPDTEKAAFDGKYAAQVSFLADVAVILRTFPYILNPPPVY